MGVPGLWTLISPCGRYMNISGLKGKILAIDASIWLYQFLNAMRDENGNTIEGAHVIGFFRRICKLLFFGILPVFVFDGKPPKLKKKVLELRKKLREKEEINYKHLAEKILRKRLEEKLGPSMALPSSRIKRARKGKKSNDPETLLSEDSQDEEAFFLKEAEADEYDDIVFDEEEIQAVVQLEKERKERLKKCRENNLEREKERRVLGETVENERAHGRNREQKSSTESQKKRAARQKNIGDITSDDVGVIGETEDLGEAQDSSRISTIKRRPKRDSKEHQPDSSSKKDLKELERRRSTGDSHEDMEMIGAAETKESEDDFSDPEAYSSYRKKRLFLPIRSFLSERRRVDEISIDADSLMDFLNIDRHRGAFSDKPPTVPTSLAPKEKPLDSIDLLEKKVYAAFHELKSEVADATDVIDLDDEESIVLPISKSTVKGNGVKNVTRESSGSAKANANMNEDPLFQEVSDFKIYKIINDDGSETMVELPLDPDIHNESFQKLPPKNQLEVLLQLQDRWMEESRRIALLTQHDMSNFSHSQVEAYYRYIKTQKEIEKIKMRIKVVDPSHGEKEAGTDATNAAAKNANEPVKAPVWHGLSPSKLNERRDQTGSALPEQPEKEKPRQHMSLLELVEQQKRQDYYTTKMAEMSKLWDTQNLTGKRKFFNPNTTKTDAEGKPKKNKTKKVEQYYSTEFSAPGPTFGDGEQRFDIGDITNQALKTFHERSGYKKNIRISSDPESGGEEKRERKGKQRGIKNEEEMSAVIIHEPAKEFDIDNLEDIFGVASDEEAMTNSVASKKKEHQRAAQREEKKEDLGEEASIEMKMNVFQEKLLRELQAIESEKGKETFIMEHAKEREEKEREMREKEERERRDREKDFDEKLLRVVIHDANSLPSPAQMAKMEQMEREKERREMEDREKREEREMKWREHQKSFEIVDASQESLESVVANEDMDIESLSSEIANETDNLFLKETDSTFANQKVNEIIVESDSEIFLQEEARKSDHEEHSPEPNDMRIREWNAIENDFSLLFDTRKQKVLSSRQGGVEREGADIGDMKEGITDMTTIDLVEKSQEVEKEEEEGIIGGGGFIEGERKGRGEERGEENREKEKRGEERKGNRERLTTIAEEPIEITEEHRKIAEDLIQQERRRLLKDSFAPASDANQPVTAKMRDEVRMLLRAFGIPWVDSPCEAEAQCARLTQLGLVDGVISDDSDCIIFGANEIVRNFFDARTNNVQYYSLRSICEQLGLSKEQLPLLAELLGCDYAPGVRGVGIVNALEVLHAYRDRPGLSTWREWVSNVMPGEGAGVKSTDSREVVEYKILHQNFREGFEFLSPDFPSDEVFDAFMNPLVDDSDENFTWGEIDAEDVSTLLSTFKFDESLVNQFLMPMLQEYNATVRKRNGAQTSKTKKMTQTSIKSFLPTKLSHCANPQAVVAFLQSKRLRRLFSLPPPPAS